MLIFFSVEYTNTPADLLALVAASSEATINVTSPSYNSADFNAGSGSGYLYLIWDLRDSIPVSLCYSDVSADDACCACAPCAETRRGYILTNTGDTSGEVQYTQCGGGVTTVEVTDVAQVSICALASVLPVVISGSVTIQVTQTCGCPS